MIPYPVANDFIAGHFDGGLTFWPPMFGFTVGQCEDCGNYDPLSQHEVCTFPGTYFDQPEYEIVYVCWECADLYMKQQAAENAMYEEMAEEYETERQLGGFPDGTM